MSSQQKAPPLTQTLSNVLANLAFMFTDEDQADVAEADVWLETKIGYKGPLAGILAFRCTRSFTVALAANLLGVDPDDDDAESQADDAVKEFMNIVCGQFVTCYHGEQAAFDLTIPEVVHLAEMPDLTVNDNDQLTTLSVDGHRMQLLYELEAGQTDI